MQIWIDKASGSWGTFDGLNLVLVDLNDVTASILGDSPQQPDSDDFDAASNAAFNAHVENLANGLSNMSDSEINDFGDAHGVPFADPTGK